YEPFEAFETALEGSHP
nr:hypothetical protein [Tanacetum cinerariifolium]